MKEYTKHFFSSCRIRHQGAIQAIKDLQTEEKNNFDCFELTDTSYALREAIALAEDTVKELKKLERMTHAKCGLIYAQSPYNGPLQTEYCTGTVKIYEIPEVPREKNRPAEYNALMDHLQVPTHLRESGLFRLHWPTFLKWYNEQVAAGKPTPAGIDVSKGTMTAEVKVRKKKEIEYLHSGE